MEIQTKASLVLNQAQIKNQIQIQPNQDQVHENPIQISLDLGLGTLKYI